MLNRIAAGRTDLVFDLIAAGVDVSQEWQGASPLAWCAYYGDVSAMRALVAAGSALSSLGPNFDLGGAAFHGHWRLCEFLIENGADVNFQDPTTGETPLHLAASVALRPGCEVVIDVLLAAGAETGKTTLPDALTGAFMRDCRTKGETALHRAAAFCTERAVQALLDAGAARDTRDAFGDTPLAWASWHQRPSSILRKLCYGPHALHPDAQWSGDHGAGWRGMDLHLIGLPRK